MKLSTSAVIYSTIVFPGAGYFVVGYKKRAIFALTISLICLGFLMVEAFHKAQIIAEKIVMGTIPYDINIIREQIILTSGILDKQTITLITFCITTVWIVGIVDSYRIGRIQEKLKQ